MTSELVQHEGLPAISPDVVEQDFAEQIDDIVPTRGYQVTPMVGIGGSAGSIAALIEFFEATPVDAGFVFVVILHLSPERESTLAELLQRTTAMPVKQAEDSMLVEANHVYVIPPGKHLTSIDGSLRLTELTPWRGKRVAVDLFFRTLADTHGPRAAAVVLSGADSDGSIGIKRIKERGGLTIAQDLGEAEYPSMPRAAVATGMVDWVLPVKQMPERLLDYFRIEHRLRLPSEHPHPQPPSPNEATDEEVLRDLLAFLKMRTGRDLEPYKRSTILRRISRRMQLNGVEDLSAYLDYLRLHAGEAAALMHDVLISVTNFFRDREALEARILELFQGKTARDAIRVWVVACASGEEAYSIAMLLLEQASKLEVPLAIQVFATDLNEDVIAAARRAFYTETIAADVSEERLRRFFVKEPGGYRLRREVREVVLFAPHDLLRDSPFSRLDLIACRNLLIYLNREAQEQILDLFHFALAPDGWLFLGSSESVDEGNPLYHVVDKKHRLYRQRPISRSRLPLNAEPGTLVRILEAKRRSTADSAVVGRASHKAFSPVGGPPQAPPEGQGRISWGELHYQLLEQFGPPSVIVNRHHDIQHLSENAGRFLQPAGGEPSLNLVRSAHPMLRIELRAALYRAAETGQPAEALRVPMELGAERYAVDIRVTPAKELARGYMLVVFDARKADSVGDAPRPRRTRRGGSWNANSRG